MLEGLARLAKSMAKSADKVPDEGAVLRLQLLSWRTLAGCRRLIPVAAKWARRHRNSAAFAGSAFLC
jgi:hypothetical protein